MRENKVVEQLFNAIVKYMLKCSREWCGFYYGYDFSKNKPIRPIYTEITSYGISMIIALNRYGFRNIVEGEHDLIDKLVKFIVKATYNGCSNRATSYGFYDNENAWSSLCYSFDNAVVASSLIDYAFLYHGRNSEVIRVAKNIVNWLVDTMQLDSGGFRAAYDRDRKVFVDFNKWYGSNGCLHVKHLIALLKAYKVLGNPRYFEASLKLIKWALRLQTSNGYFPAREGENYVFHHAHCYAVEGLLYAWYMLRNESYLNSILSASDWLKNIFSRYNAITMTYPVKNLNVKLVTDATAQAARIWLILYKVTGDKDYLELIDKAMNFLLKAMSKVGLISYSTTRLLGGLLSVKDNYSTAWSNMFMLHLVALRSVIDSLSLDLVFDTLF